MKFAYADPPYFGCAAKHYSKHHEGAADYDTLEAHQKLVERLCSEYPDGWAMSLSSPSLQKILPLCPTDIRVMAWVKPFCSFKPGVGLAYAWEPIILRGGRKITRQQKTVRDFVSCNITLKKGLSGAKPEAFTHWLLSALNAEPDDQIDDLFPGSGMVQQAINSWKSISQNPFPEPLPAPSPGARA